MHQHRELQRYHNITADNKTWFTKLHTPVFEAVAAPQLRVKSKPAYCALS
jgi:hypothetical protein